MFRFSNFRLLGLFIILAMLLISPQPANAISKSGKKAPKKYHRQSQKQHQNNWSFQFAFEDEYDDNEFDGIRLSLQKKLNRNSAVKFSLGVLDKIEDPFYNTAFYNNNGISFMYDGFPDDYEEVNFSIQFVQYPNFNHGLNFYWGVGPRLSVSEAKYDPDVYVDVPSRMDWVDYTRFNSTNRIGLGVEGNLGAELFLGRSFSIVSEYGFIVENRWYVFDVDYFSHGGYNVNEVETFNDGSHVDWSRFRLGFALHF